MLVAHGRFDGKWNLVPGWGEHEEAGTLVLIWFLWFHSSSSTLPLSFFRIRSEPSVCFASGSPWDEKIANKIGLNRPSYGGQMTLDKKLWFATEHAERNKCWPLIYSSFALQILYLEKYGLANCHSHGTSPVFQMVPLSFEYFIILMGEVVCRQLFASFVICRHYMHYQQKNLGWLGLLIQNFRSILLVTTNICWL